MNNCIVCIVDFFLLPQKDVHSVKQLNFILLLPLDYRLLFFVVTVALWSMPVLSFITCSALAWLEIWLIRKCVTWFSERSAAIQGASDSYTASPTYQSPIPLGVISEDSSVDSPVSPASVSPSITACRRLHSQQQQQPSNVDRSSCDEHYYSEINSEQPYSSSSSTSLSSSLSSAATSLAASAAAVTSSSHVTETDTPTKQAAVADAVYSGLDAATRSQHPSLPSVYQTFGDTNEVES